MGTSSERVEAEYDVLGYPNEPLLKAHPDTMATLGRLFGLDPAPVQRCRVLELGCGSAENLLPMAVNLPGSSFVGVDLSAVHLAVGQRRAAALSLSNVQLLHRDLVALDASIGRFDYVICHGLFSWVHPAVRLEILSLCQQVLAPEGIAFVSYNAYPGGYLRQMLREMLLRASRDTDEPRDKVRQARVMLASLQDSIGMSHNEVVAALQPELVRLSRSSDGYLFHEYLTQHNQAFWFDEFIQLAGRHGLKYLANAIAETMTAANYGEAIAAAVSQIADPVAAQQRLDVALGRRFNSTLLCRAERRVTREIASDVLQALYYDAWIEPDPSLGRIDDTTSIAITSSVGATARVRGKDLRTALGVLHGVRPRGLHFDTLFDEVVVRLPAAAETRQRRRRELAAQLGRLYLSAVVGLSTHQPTMTSAISDRPCASRLARLQAAEQTWVTNQWHQKVQLTNMQRQLLVTLDGTRPPEDRQTLAYFARCGLLVA